MWTLQWWNLLLENRTLYSVSPVCLWWTISLQSPTGNILFIIILWHPDTTQVSPREVINKRQSPQVWTTVFNSPHSDFCRRIGQIETLVSPKFVQWSSFTWQHRKNRSLWGEICSVFLVLGIAWWQCKQVVAQEVNVLARIISKLTYTYKPHISISARDWDLTKHQAKVLSSIVQFNSVAQSCPVLCNSMDCSMPGFPVHCQLPELAQTHVHPVGDAIQPSHPLSSPSPPVFNLSQHQGQ